MENLEVAAYEPAEWVLTMEYLTFLFSMVKGAWNLYEHRRGGTREWFRLDIYTN